MDVRELHRELHRAPRQLEAVHDEHAPEDALAGLARRARELRLEVQRPRRAAREEPGEGEEMRAAARPAVGLGEPAEEGSAEARADEGLESARGIAAALAPCRRRGLEGHDGLARLEALEAPLRRVDARLELHAVDDARELERIGNGNQPALAEVEHLPADGEARALRAPRLEAEEARVERIARGVEGHRRRR